MQSYVEAAALQISLNRLPLRVGGLGRIRTLMGATRLWLIAVALGLMLIAACSGDGATQTSLPGDGQRVTAPDVTVLPPTPIATPTPTFIPLGLPLPTATATPRPAPTPEQEVPTATPLPDGLTQETLEKIFCQLSVSGGVTEDEIDPQLYPFRRFDHVASLLDDGRIIMGGGFTGNANNNFIVPDWHPTVDVYDTRQAAWCTVPLPIGLTFNNEFVPLSDGSLLMVGISWPDEQNGEPTPHTLILDAESLEFSQVAPPEAPSAIAQLALLEDGRVLRVGGLLLDPGEDPDADPTSTGVEIYDPASDSWTPASSIDPEPTLPASAGLSPPQWLFPMTGGKTMFVRIGDVGESSDQGLIEIYDAATDSWHVEAEFNAGWDHPWHVMMTSKDTLYVFYESSVDIYDPDTNLWSSTYNSRGIPSHSSVTELPDGRLLVAGGYADAGQYDVYPSTRTEIYDPSTTIWAAGPELAEPRRDHSATLMPDGSVFLFGGIGVVADIDEIAPWNTLDVIPAETLTAIDTVTQPEEFTLAASLLSTCANAVNPEPLPEAVADANELQTSATELLAMAGQAMQALTSYATAHVGYDYTVDTLADESRSRSSECSLGAATHMSPNRARTLFHIVWDRQEVWVWENIRIGQDTYDREMLDEHWQHSELDLELPWRPAEDSFVSDEWLGMLIGMEIVGIESLDGVDVYHVDGQFSYDEIEQGNTIAYWIGVEDLLVRRIIRKWGLSTYDDGTVRHRNETVEFHSFDEDFEIQSPPDDEIAE